MTIKEAARDLGVSENFIYGLIKDGVIDYFVVGKLDYPAFIIHDNGFARKVSHESKFNKQIEIDPEELDYIDWYINVGRYENHNIRRIARENHDFQAQNWKKMTIEIYY